LKSISCDSIFVGGEEEYVFYSQKADANDVIIQPDEVVSQTVNFVQNYIEKQYELRITVIGEDVVACKIDSQLMGDTTGRIDWRQGYDHDLHHEIVDVPERIKVFCLRFLKELKLKVLRVFRLFRIFRYMKSFRILGDAIASKKQELTISMVFLTILTVILSFLLFFAEHAAQPELCENGWKTLVWAFAKYLGDPGGIAGFPMVTVWGNIIAIIVGILGIAIFAVPAGLISSGFIEVIEERKKNEVTRKNVEKLHFAFERKLDRPTQFQIVPMFVSIADVQSRLKMSEPDIYDALENSEDFRLVNLAATQTVDQHPEDRLAIEHFPLNRPYGVCIDRGSKITIVSSSSLVDPIMGHFSYYLAKIGGFNYVSRDIGICRPYKSFYLINDNDKPPFLEDYMDDINRLSAREGSWIITLLAASGANEPTYPTEFHFTYGGKKGDETYDGENLTIHDIEKFDALYQNLSGQLEHDFGYHSDRQRYHNSFNPNLFVRHLVHPEKVNALMLRVAWSVTCWDMRRMQVAKVMADNFSQSIEGEIKPYSDDLKNKGIGYADYND